MEKRSTSKNLVDLFFIESTKAGLSAKVFFIHCLTFSA